jgi:NTP pyrophosphatase (non-canonical NTP hydrolase)
MSELDLAEVREYLRRFASERDWEQFHTPKNLAMALAGEAGELLEVFQWLTPEQSTALTDEQRHAVADEVADVLQYVIRLADVAGIELAREVWRKLRENEARYAVGEVRGSAEKRSG